MIHNNNAFVALCGAAVLVMSMAAAQNVMVGSPKVSAQRLNSSAVLLGVVVGPETARDGDLVQYRVLIDNHDSTASVVDIRDSMCCKDADGKCQVWHGHQNQVVCHGVSVSVDYRVTVVSVGVAASPVTGEVSQVLIPVRMRAGQIRGQHDADLVADPARWEQFRSAALSKLVHGEVDRIQAQPQSVPAPPTQRLDMVDDLKPGQGPSETEHEARWIWIGISAAALVVVVVLAFLAWWYRREQRRKISADLLEPYHDPYADGGALYLPL